MESDHAELAPCYLARVTAERVSSPRMARPSETSMPTSLASCRSRWVTSPEAVRPMRNVSTFLPPEVAEGTPAPRVLGLRLPESNLPELSESEAR